MWIFNYNKAKMHEQLEKKKKLTYSASAMGWSSVTERVNIGFDLLNIWIYEKKMIKFHKWYRDRKMIKLEAFDNLFHHYDIFL